MNKAMVVATNMATDMAKNMAIQLATNWPAIQPTI